MWVDECGRTYGIWNILLCSFCKIHLFGALSVTVWNVWSELRKKLRCDQFWFWREGMGCHHQISIFKWFSLQLSLIPCYWSCSSKLSPFHLWLYRLYKRERYTLPKLFNIMKPYIIGSIIVNWGYFCNLWSISCLHFVFLIPKSNSLFYDVMVAVYVCLFI